MTNHIKKLFDSIKTATKSNKLTIPELEHTSSNIELLKQEAINLEQRTLLNKLQMQKDFTDKLIECVKSGYDTYVLKSDIVKLLETETVENVQVLALKPLAEFPRPIPKENANEIKKALPLFDHIMILYTDYTQNDREAHEKEQIEKDPIAFGILRYENGNTQGYSNHLIFITDWIDEYCDLTLDKLIDVYNIKSHKLGD